MRQRAAAPARPPAPSAPSCRRCGRRRRSRSRRAKTNRRTASTAGCVMTVGRSFGCSHWANSTRPSCGEMKLADLVAVLGERELRGDGGEKQATRDLIGGGDVSERLAVVAMLKACCRNRINLPIDTPQTRRDPRRSRFAPRGKQPTCCWTWCGILRKRPGCRSSSRPTWSWPSRRSPPPSRGASSAGRRRSSCFRIFCCRAGIGTTTSRGWRPRRPAVIRASAIW